MRGPHEEGSRVCLQALESPLGMKPEKKGRLKQVACGEAGDEAEGWIWRRHWRVEIAFPLP